MPINKQNALRLAVPLILIAAIAIFYSFFYQHTIAGITWPRTTDVDQSSDEAYALTLGERFSAFNGEWPKETMFFVALDKIKEIEVYEEFRFLDFKFKHGAIIEVLAKDHFQLYVKGNYKVDGLELDQECLLNFKNKVLFSAQCPGEDEKLFKRFISPDSLEFELDGEIKEVE